MAKKRQHDFSRVQLKPGRLLNKRSNITSTKFKSKKIIMPKEKPVKMKSMCTINDCIKKIKNAGNEKDKYGHLCELNKLIDRQPDNLNTFLPEIFGIVLDLIRDPFDVVRNAALKAIISVLENTDDFQLLNYAELVNNSISAVMKNPNQKISNGALVLFDCMLKYHPDLMCHNISFLYDLLPTERRHYTRKIFTEKETYQYSEKEEINALGHMNAFLKNLLRIKNSPPKEQNEDDKLVYMDETKPMCLELYSGGGLQPIDIEEAYSKEFYPKIDPFDEIEKLIPIIDELVRLIPSFFCQIIGTESNADDNMFRSDPISDLSILIQLLCSVAELAEKMSYSVAVTEIKAFLKEKVFSTHRKRFPFELHTFMDGMALQPLAMLNTSLIFLFFKFLLPKNCADSEQMNCSDSEPKNCADSEDWELIKDYLLKLFSVYSPEIKLQCIPLFVQMIQLYSYKSEVPDVILLLLKKLVPLLKLRFHNPNKKILTNFLLNMSLLPEYKFWVNSEAMELWYDWLLSHCKDYNRLDKHLMKMMCKIAKLRHYQFISYLDFSLVKPLLKHRNEDIKETAIFLLHNMDINKELLNKIYDVIYPDSFPRKFTVTLIQMLNVRFEQYPASERPYVDYIEFLLNIAIDTYSINSGKLVDFDANEYSKAAKLVQHGHNYGIVPSLHWEEHSQVFEICQFCLNNLPRIAVDIMFVKVVKELLCRRTILPVHCALAILKLDAPHIKKPRHRLRMRDLNFSCLMTTSVLTKTPISGDWYKWNVDELLKSISLTESTALGIIDLVNEGHFINGEPDSIVIYHIYRILKVFLERRLFDYESPENSRYMSRILRHLAEEYCDDSNMKLQPLYLQLQNFFSQYF